MQKTFRDSGMIGGHFKDAKDDLLSEYLVEFLKSYDESKEFQRNKERKRELKSFLEVIYSLYPDITKNKREWKNTIGLQLTSFVPIQNLGNDFDDQKSRLKKKRTKLSKSIAFKVEMEMFKSKMIKQMPPSDGIEKIEIGKDAKKEAEPGPSTIPEVQGQDRQPDPIEATNG